MRLTGYHNLITRCRDDGYRGVGIFINDHITYTLRDDLSVFIPHIHVFESVLIEFGT